MRIVFDLQACQSASRLRGIGRYSLSLAQTIIRQAGAHEVWLLLNDLLPDSVTDLRQSFSGLVPPDHIAVFRAPGPVAEFDPANTWRARCAEVVREHAITELEPDFLHISSLFEGFVDDAVTSITCLHEDSATAVTLYDLIPLLTAAQERRAAVRPRDPRRPRGRALHRLDARGVGLGSGTCGLQAAASCAERARPRRCRSVELPIEERPPVIAAYRAKVGKEVNQYFDKLPDPADHPVFRLE